jgi:hypothetical protein
MFDSPHFTLLLELSNRPSSSLTHPSYYWESFNKPVDYLPSSLIYLSITDSRFNQPIDHLPSSLTQILLGSHFNQPIDYLHDSLLHLEFDKRSTFNQPIAYLPSRLISLTLGKKFKSLWITSHTPSPIFLFIIAKVDTH